MIGVALQSAVAIAFSCGGSRAYTAQEVIALCADKYRFAGEMAVGTRRDQFTSRADLMKKAERGFSSGIASQIPLPSIDDLPATVGDCDKLLPAPS